MKRILKITIILIILIMTIGNMNYIYADPGTRSLEIPDGGSGSTSSIPEWSNTLDDYWNPSRETTNTDEIDQKAVVLITVIRDIGIVVSVVALMVIGIRNMTASIEQKSVIKEAMPGYILGIILVVAITYLPTVIYKMVQHIK